MNLASHRWVWSLAAIALWTMLCGVNGLLADDPNEKPSETKNLKRLFRDPDLGPPEEAKQKLVAIREEAERLLKEGNKEESQKLLRLAEDLAQFIQRQKDTQAAASEEVQQKLQAIRAEAERLIKEGKKEEAQKLLQHAEDLARKIKGQGDPHAEAREELKAIHQKIEILLKAGKQEEAEKLMRYAEDFARKLKAGGAKSKPAADSAQDELKAIHQKIEILLKEGRKEEAEKLKFHAEEFVRKLKGAKEAKEKSDADGPLHLKGLQQKIEVLLKEGRTEEAEKLKHYAAELASKLKQVGAPDKPAPEKIAPDDLRSELQQIHRELRELREQVKQLIELQRERK